LRRDKTGVHPAATLNLWLTDGSNVAAELKYNLFNFS